MLSSVVDPGCSVFDEIRLSMGDNLVCAETAPMTQLVSEAWAKQSSAIVMDSIPTWPLLDGGLLRNRQYLT